MPEDTQDETAQAETPLSTPDTASNSTPISDETTAVGAGVSTPIPEDPTHPDHPTTKGEAYIAELVQDSPEIAKEAGDIIAGLIAWGKSLVEKIEAKDEPPPAIEDPQSSR